LSTINGPVSGFHHPLADLYIWYRNIDIAAISTYEYRYKIHRVHLLVVGSPIDAWKCH